LKRFLWFTGQAKDSELAEVRSKYRDLVIRSELEKQQIEIRSEVERRTLDFLTSGKQEGLRDAVIKAAMDQK